MSEKKKDGLQLRPCVYCGKQFEPRRRDQIFCTKACCTASTKIRSARKKMKHQPRKPEVSIAQVERARAAYNADPRNDHKSYGQFVAMMEEEDWKAEHCHK